MLWLWTAIVRPAITYACHVWGSNLTKTQVNKLNKVQRLALMQTGNYRYTTPESGLNMVLGQLPLDLQILNTGLNIQLRNRNKFNLGWKGKAGGPKGQVGHIRLLNELLTHCEIPLHNLDQIDKIRLWEKRYSTTIEPSGADIPNGLRLYTDGSLVEGKAGFGAVLLNDDDEVVKDLSGPMGEKASVFQAECQAIHAGTVLK